LDFKSYKTRFILFSETCTNWTITWVWGWESKMKFYEM